MLNTENKNNLLEVYYQNVESFLDIEKYINSEGDLAVNVKWHHPYIHNNIYDKHTDISLEQLNEEIIDTFWYKANQIAIHYGYAACYSFGRSNGWALPISKNKQNNYKGIPAKDFVDKNNLELERLIQLKIFSMFASDIESLFDLIKSEIRNVKSRSEFNQLQNRIYDL